MKISVVICTKNEERNIERCLKAANSVADEIIIMDSFSTDQTESICRKFEKVIFHQTQWLGFSNTKNKANELARSEYILSLDADEVLSDEIQQEILEMKSKLTGYYQINRKTNYCGKWIHYSGWFPDRHVRLFPKIGSAWSEDLVHEKLIFDRNQKVLDLKGLVYHYSVIDLQDHLNKINKYSELAARKLAGRSRISLAFSMLLNPVFRFFRHSILKFGFLDGLAGLQISILSAYSVFLKYKKAFKEESIPKL